MKIIENGLIPIYEDNQKKVVNARELHEFLESGQDFSNWIKNRIEKYGFIEDEDFSIILLKTSDNGRPRTEYILSLDTAKEIAMVENNEQGRRIRKYFIEVEKRANRPMTQAEILAGQAQLLVEIERQSTLALQTAQTAQKTVNNAIDIFTAPIDKEWRQTMNGKIRGICLDNGLNYRTFFGDLYKELEQRAGVDLDARLRNLRKRLLKEGHTKTYCEDVKKLEVIEREKLLRPIFEDIVRKYQAKYLKVS